MAYKNSIWKRKSNSSNYEYNFREYRDNKSGNRNRLERVNNKVVLLKKAGVQELRDEPEDVKEKIECIGIETDNLLQEFRDKKAENMMVTKLKWSQVLRN
jgi:hypothetical protein